MKILGLIGGLSWVSTVDYYRLINEGINERLGGLNFAQCIIYSFNYADIKKNNDANDWETTFEMVFNACKILKNSGADAIVLCANTMHYIADRLEKEIRLPIIHIATATAIEVQKSGIQKVGLLGTKFTMELDFFKLKLTSRGIEAIIPNEADIEFIQNSIYYELGKGIVKPDTKKRYLSIIEDLIKNGAKGIILGCTEIPLIVKDVDITVPAFDTALIHSEAAVKFSLG
jgi:aspartate racemase